MAQTEDLEEQLNDSAPDSRLAAIPGAGRHPGEAAATAASIWCAIDAAVLAAAAEANVPVTDRPARRTAPRGWLARAAGRVRRRR